MAWWGKEEGKFLLLVLALIHFHLWVNCIYGLNLLESGWLSGGYKVLCSRLITESCREVHRRPYCAVPTTCWNREDTDDLYGEAKCFPWAAAWLQSMQGQPGVRNCIMSLLNSCLQAQMSVTNKTNYPLFQDYLEAYGCEIASKFTFTFIPYSPSANGNHVGYLNWAWNLGCPTKHTENLFLQLWIQRADFPGQGRVLVKLPRQSDSPVGSGAKLK